MRGKPRRTGHLATRQRIIPAHAGQTRARWTVMRWRPDHPRACGANRRLNCPTAFCPGSSPRMRGKQCGIRVGDGQRRIIPAHAGQTNRCLRCRPSRPDHPRACGANTPANLLTVWRYGSSPRMRGKHSVGFAQVVHPRIIPAHAGQTSACAWAALPWTDHPRACGANLSQIGMHSRPAGSSPRMRGKRPTVAKKAAKVRIIPAHAGQTRHDIPTSGRSPDHPRACGANMDAPIAAQLRVGSSPRMRGKPENQTRPTIRGLDHPRACGANARRRAYCHKTSGSSPRMRGKHRRACEAAARSRIIPAHAGQTLPQSAQIGIGPDHPRACGANKRSLVFNDPEYGSSPRMRGKHGQFVVSHVCCRIIPAHAGQTRRLEVP